MQLNPLAKDIRFDNASKGFDPLEGGINRYLLLAISEIVEAQEEIRNGHDPKKIYYAVHVDPTNNGLQKPEGFPVEICDAIIRLLDIGAKIDMDFDDNRILPLPWHGQLDTYMLEIVFCISRAHQWEYTEYDFKYQIGEAVSSLFLICETFDIDSIAVINEKLAYNRSRPPKHGRKF